MENASLKYGIYCRKSSETEDRQVLSLGDQLARAHEIARAIQVKIPEPRIFTEAKSAKETNNRPAYAEMLRKIEQGEVNAIIAWNADRLSRNAIDTALLVDLMDRGRLLEIVTPSQTFRNTPMDKFMLSLACSQAKMENDKKGIDVKRGLRQKASLGVKPGMAAIGYMNDPYTLKGQKKIARDPERFDLVRKMWDMLLTGYHNPIQILNTATNEWGLRSKNGKPISRSGIYWLFSNPFYYGMFEFPEGSGEWFEGSHESMITPEEFDRAQAILGSRGRPRPKKHVFDFVGLIKCAECDAAVTAETKTKTQKNGVVRTYVYYHCTKRRRTEIPCSQGSIEASELKRQITAELESIEIPEEFHEFAMKWIRSENAKESFTHQVALESRQKAYNRAVARLGNLIDMRAAGEISAEEFGEKQQKYLREKRQLSGELKTTDDRVEGWNKACERVFTFAETAKQRFETGPLEVKREILSTLGSNLLLKDKKLLIDIDKSLLPLKKAAPVIKRIKKRFEPINTQEKQGQFGQECLKSPIVLRR